MWSSRPWRAIFVHFGFAKREGVDLFAARRTTTPTSPPARRSHSRVTVLRCPGTIRARETMCAILHCCAASGSSRGVEWVVLMGYEVVVVADSEGRLSNISIQAGENGTRVVTVGRVFGPNR
jgi:hypothetical protein